MVLPKYRRFLRSLPRREVAILAVVALGSGALAIAFELNEALVKLTNRYPLLDELGIDELPIAFTAIAVSFAWFAHRRWHQYRAEADAHRATSQKLELALREAMAANRAKTLFLANMSHELRTPLNAILGFSDILRHQKFGPLPNRRYREYAEDIHFSGSHLLSVITEILELARSEAGALHFEREAVSARELLDQVARMIEDRAEKGGVTLEKRADPGLEIWADPDRLRQALLNLAINAVKFTPSGGRVTLAARRQDGQALIEVADTGIGMEAAEIPLALLPFQQIDSGLQRKFEGTGLGLPLAKCYVEQQGGGFELTSTPWLGTTVVIRLPVVGAPALLA